MIYKCMAMLLGMALVLLTLPGCVGYRLGSTLPPDVKAIYVNLFINKCNEPLLEIDTTNATIAEFQMDGTLRIVPKDEADVLLETTLNALTLTPLSYDQTSAEPISTDPASIVCVKTRQDQGDHDRGIRNRGIHVYFYRQSQQFQARGHSRRIGRSGQADCRKSSGNLVRREERGVWSVERGVRRLTDRAESVKNGGDEGQTRMALR